jgi:hypothetical protein
LFLVLLGNNNVDVFFACVSFDGVIIDLMFSLDLASAFIDDDNDDNNGIVDDDDDDVLTPLAVEYVLKAFILF